MRRSRLAIQLRSAVQELSSSPISHIGDLTITFPLNSDLASIQQQLRHFQQNVLLRLLNTRGVRVLTRVGARYHVHFLIDFNFDLQTGFDWVAFKHYQQLHREWLKSKLPTTYRLMMIALSVYQQSMNIQLAKLQHSLQRWGDKHNFGRLWLLPIRTNLHACCCYLQSNLPYYRTATEKGCRFITHWGLNEVLKNEQFSPHNKWYSQMRSRLTQFASNLGLTSEQASSTMIALYGSRWQWTMKSLIRDISQPSSKQLNQLYHIRQNILIEQLKQQA